MNEQTTVSNNAALFDEWRKLTKHAEGPHGLDEADFNSLCDQIRDMERNIAAAPVQSPDDVWRVVVVLLDEPEEGQQHQEAILARKARTALGLPLNRQALDQPPF